MDSLNKKTPNPEETKEKKGEQERKIDEQLEQTFPASDPPSYSQPGNSIIDDNKKDSELSDSDEDKGNAAGKAVHQTDSARQGEQTFKYSNDEDPSDESTLGGDKSSVSDTGLGSTDERNRMGEDKGDENIGTKN